jgi:xanthine/uracil permease
MLSILGWVYVTGLVLIAAFGLSVRWNDRAFPPWINGIAVLVVAVLWPVFLAFMPVCLIGIIAVLHRESRGSTDSSANASASSQRQPRESCVSPP